MKGVPSYIEIPAGAQLIPCRGAGCGRMIFMVPTKNATMPVDADQPDCYPPAPTAAGRGIPHWATCPAAVAFRKRGKK